MASFSFEAWGGTAQISSCSKHEETYRVTFSLKHEEPQVNFQPVQSMRQLAHVWTCLRPGRTQDEFQPFEAWGGAGQISSCSKHEETKGDFQHVNFKAWETYSTCFNLFKAWRDIGWVSPLKHKEAQIRFHPVQSMKRQRVTFNLLISKHERHSISFNLFEAWRDTGWVSALKHGEAQVRCHPVQSMKRQRVTFNLLISKHERHSISFNLFEAWRDTGWVSALKHGEAQVRCHPVQSMKRQRVTFSLKHEEPQVNFQPVQSMRHTTSFNLFKAWRDTWQISALKHDEAQVRFHPVQSMKRHIGWLSACSRHEETQVNFQHVQSMRNIAQVSTCLRHEAERTHGEFQLWSMGRHRSDVILFKAWRGKGWLLAC